MRTIFGKLVSKKAVAGKTCRALSVLLVMILVLSVTVTTIFATDEEEKNSIQSAITAIGSNGSGTITLTADSQESIEIPYGKTVILDLAGFTLSGDDWESPTITNHGTLILTGMGTVFSDVEMGYAIYNDGTLTLSNCDISGYTGIQIEGGTVTVGTGASVTGVLGIEQIDGDLIIDGGAVTGTGTGIYIGGGTTTVKAGTVTGDSYNGIELLDGDLLIEGGTIGGYFDAISVYDGTLSIISGYFSPLTDDITNNIAEGSAVTETPNADGYYQVYIPSSTSDYTYAMNLTITDNDSNYNVGEKISVDIMAYGSGDTNEFGSFDFTLDYDGEKVTLSSLTTSLGGYCVSNLDSGTMAFAISGESGIAVGAVGTVIATAIFTVDSGISTGSTQIGLEGANMNHKGADISTAVSVEDIGVTANLYHLKLTIGSVENGTWSNNTTTFSVDYNAILGEISGLPTATANSNYTFSAYTVDGQEIDIETYAITSDITLNAVCVVSGFTFTSPSFENAEFTVTSGVSEDIASYGTDVVFSVTPIDGYGVTDITVTVGSASVDFTAGEGNDTSTTKTYTISGEDIIDEVVVTVTIQKIHTVTFVDVEGGKLDGEDTTLTYYAVDGTSTLYTTAQTIGGDNTTTEVPTATADSGYRLGDDIWSDGEGTLYADNEAVSEIAFTGDMTLTAQVVKQYSLTFQAYENEANGTVTTCTYFIDAGSGLSVSNCVEITESYTANDGYQFVGWVDINGTEVVLEDIVVGTSNAVYYAVFEQTSFTVTLPDGVTGGDSSAQRETDYVFTPAQQNQIIYGVYAAIGGGDATALTANEDGSYTIDGDSIIGNIVITVDSFGGTLSFLDKSDYMALENNTAIRLLTTDWLDGNQYVFDGEIFYYSSKYGGYVQIVSTGAGYDAMTDATLAAKFGLISGSAVEIDYSGDLNGDGTVLGADGAMVNAMLHDYEVYYTITDLMRFQADVNGDQKVTTDDILQILNIAAGISSGS